MPDAFHCCTHHFAPQTDDKTNMTLVLLHDAHQSIDTIMTLGRTLSPTAALLAIEGEAKENGEVEYFRKTDEALEENSSPILKYFFHLIEGDSEPYQDMTGRTQELGVFIDDAVKKYQLNPDRIIIAGIGRGASEAANLMMRRPKQFTAAMLIRPVAPFIDDNTLTVEGVPMFISELETGEVTPKILADRFTQHGAIVTYKSYTNEQILKSELTDAAAWLIYSES
jgi:phospholipase/carboxylesterase